MMDRTPGSTARGPYRFLAYAGLVVGASSRLAHAVAVSIALFTVFTLSSFILGASAPLLPRRGRRFVTVFIASFTASCFQLLFSLYSPALALDLSFFIGLVPVTFMASSASEYALSPGTAALASLREALPVAGLISAFALVRESFGYGCLTFPARSGAFVILGSDASSSLAIRVLVSAAGGFMLFGYVLAGLRRLRSPFPDSAEQARVE